MGLITEIRPPDQQRTYVGSPGYLPSPPELPGTPQADICALSMVLYVLSSGHNPAHYPEVSTTMADTRSLTGFFPLNAIILNARDPDPARRYPSAAHLHRASSTPKTPSPRHQPTTQGGLSERAGSAEFIPLHLSPLAASPPSAAIFRTARRPRRAALLPTWTAGL